MSFNKKIDSITSIKKHKKKPKEEITVEKRKMKYRVYKSLIDNLLNNYNYEDFKTVSLACYTNIIIQEIVNEILDEKINKGNIEAKKR